MFFLLIATIFIAACHIDTPYPDNKSIVLPQECVTLIPAGQRSSKAGECSGPYTLRNPEFYIWKNNSLALGLTHSSLPGSAAHKHTTVLYAPSAIGAEDKKAVELSYKEWRSSKVIAADAPITFYLNYWGGKKSELITGELKQLIEYIRAAFPDKAPHGTHQPIHVQLSNN